MRIKAIVRMASDKGGYWHLGLQTLEDVDGIDLIGQHVEIIVKEYEVKKLD